MERHPLLGSTPARSLGARTPAARASEPHVAGHSTHFLRRLDRVSERHVEIALALYRDPVLVKAILGRIALPLGADRVAFSLEDASEGPFVVVTRDGRFVTCLAQGMHVGPETPIVTKAMLRATAVHFDVFRENIAKADRLAENEGADTEIARLLRQMEIDGLYFPRERAVELLRWLPLIADQMPALYSETLELTWSRFDVAVYAAHTGRRTAKHDEGMKAWLRLYGGCGQMQLLSAVTGLYVGLEDALTYHPEQQHESRIALSIGEGIRAATFRTSFALWSSIRAGVSLVPSLAQLSTPAPTQETILRDLALLGLSCSPDPDVRDAALPVLRQTLATPSAHPETREIVETVLARDEAAHRQAGEQLAERTYRRFVRDDCMPRGVHHPSDVDPDVARTLRALGAEMWCDYADSRTALAEMMPWMARAEPAEMFLPQAWCDAFRCVDTAFYHRRTLRQLADVRGHVAPRTVTRSEPRIGRNDLCSCGSGKKYKRCCLAAKRAA